MENQKHYSQFTALLAIAKGAFKSILRSPSSVAFSLGFPLIFIFGFVFLDADNSFHFNVGYDASADTTSAIFQKIKSIDGIVLERKNKQELQESIQRNNLIALIEIDSQKNSVNILAPDFANKKNIEILQTLLQSAFYQENNDGVKVAKKQEVISGRQYKTIDFILPGQLGFALLGASVFGVAFLFFNLRQELVLKRFFATPITKANILLGETLARTVFQLLSATVVILIGLLFFNFTLLHGFWTYLQIMLLSFMALIVFMGCGFMVSGVAASSSAIPALANVFTLPQFILAGTFFPVEKFPVWLQAISNVLPLTHFNNAMRRICFDGATLLDCWVNVSVIIIWGILIYVLAIRFFKWE